MEKALTELVVYKASDKYLFVALKKIQKREITIFCVKLGHINDLSTYQSWIRNS